MGSNGPLPSVAARSPANTMSCVHIPTPWLKTCCVPETTVHVTGASRYPPKFFLPLRAFLGILLELSWGLLGSSWAVLRPSCAILGPLGPSRGLLGQSCDHLGGSFGCLRTIFAVFGRLLAVLEPSEGRRSRWKAKPGVRFSEQACVDGGEVGPKKHQRSFTRQQRSILIRPNVPKARWRM